MTVLARFRDARRRFVDGMDIAVLDAHQPVGGEPDGSPICAGRHPDRVPFWPCAEWTAANTRRWTRRQQARRERAEP